MIFQAIRCSSFQHVAASNQYEDRGGAIVALDNGDGNTFSPTVHRAGSTFWKGETGQATRVAVGRGCHSAVFRVSFYWGWGMHITLTGRSIAPPCHTLLWTAIVETMGTPTGPEGMRTLGELPTSLYEDICALLHVRVIRKVPPFKNCEEPFIMQLVTRLSPAVYMPGETIFRGGDVGHEMYLISKGKVRL